MAAWKARLEGTSTFRDHFTIDVGYYASTDTGFTTLLWRESVRIVAGMSDAEVAKAVRESGIAARAQQDAKAAFLVGNPLDTTINIP